MSNFDVIHEYYDRTTPYEPSTETRFNDFADHLEFLHRDALNRDGELRYLNVRARSSRNVWKSLIRQVRSENFEDVVHELWCELHREHSGWSWYTPTGLQRTRPSTANGGATKSRSEPPWVAVFDIDIATAADGHKLDFLGTEDEALDAIEYLQEKLERRFDAIWFTGGGIQGAMKLTEPLGASDGQLWEQVPNAYLRKHRVRIDNLKSHGAQLIRLAGSTNAKYEDAPVVRWLSEPRNAKLDSSLFGSRVRLILDDLDCIPQENEKQALADTRESVRAQTDLPTQRKQIGTTARPGDRLNQAVTPLDVLRLLMGAQPSTTLGRYEVPTGSGTMTSGGGIATFPDGGIFFHSSKAAMIVGVPTGFTCTEAFALLCEMYGSNSFYTLADAIEYVERQERPVSDFLLLLREHPDEASLRNAIGPSFRQRASKH